MTALLEEVERGDRGEGDKGRYVQGTSLYLPSTHVHTHTHTHTHILIPSMSTGEIANGHSLSLSPYSLLCEDREERADNNEGGEGKKD